jgi:hypothetical protein
MHLAMQATQKQLSLLRDSGQVLRLWAWWSTRPYMSTRLCYRLTNTSQDSMK